MRMFNKIGLTLKGVIVLLAIAVGMTVLPAGDVQAAEDGCVSCHGREEYLVTNKKLYEYFQRWRISSHAQEDVSCVDCHGGNNLSANKVIAHGGLMGIGKSSATNFRNIPKTCGQCHDDKYKAYSGSHHFKQMSKNGGKGPNCVTCHGSLNAVAPDVTSVAETCKLCHNKKYKNHPDIPLKAEKLLNDFNAIAGYARYIQKRAKPAMAAKLAKEIGPQIDSLSDVWHSFDLNKIEPQTKGLLQMIKQKRLEVRESNKKK